MASDRTEKATPKRREDARKKGQIARGPKLPAAAGFLAALFVMRMTGNDWLHHARHCFVSMFSQAVTRAPLTEPTAQSMLIEASWSLLLLVMPITSAVLVAVIGGNFMQDGFTLTPQALVPKWERFSPFSNLKRMFSSQTLVEFFKNIIELSVISMACYGLIGQAITDAPALIKSPASRTLLAIGSLAYDVCIRVGAIMLLFAGLDYGYKWYKHEKSLRMTKQEIKEEYRSQEGDPMAKGQRRKAARALVQRRMAAEVPRADVVVTNPTHFAVALLYDGEKAHAPLVIAKGADLMAKRIREIATANDVPIVENPPLARMLYRDVEPGQTIPSELFRAVAEILAYVYRKRQMAEQ